jgi:hypothetical protein
MELLPELFDTIFNQLYEVRDRKALLFTCKKYYRQYSRKMIDIKYAIFYITSGSRGYFNSDFVGICDSVGICKKYIKKNLVKKPITTPAFISMNKENNYTLFTSRNKLDDGNFNHYAGRGYIIEEIKIMK